MEDGNIKISKNPNLVIPGRPLYKKNRANKGGVFYFTSTLYNIDIDI